MATHSSSLAWKIPWTEEPGGLQSTASQRVRHDRVLSHSIVFLRHISHQPAWIKPTLTAARQGPVTQWEAKSTSAYLDFPCPVIDQDPPVSPPLASAPAQALGALQPRDLETLLHPGKHPGHPKSGPALVIRKLTLAQPKGPVHPLRSRVGSTGQGTGQPRPGG